MRRREANHAAMVGNDSVIAFITSSASVHQSLLLVEQYQKKEEMKGKEEMEWVCKNESCKKRCPYSLQRCPYCLTDRNSHSLHVVFMLHGFRVRKTPSNHN